LLGIEALKQIELATLPGRGSGRGQQIADRELIGRHARSSYRGALVSGGKKGIAVISRSAIAGGGSDGDEAGEVLVFAAQAISDPGPH
jgi:hypothetical protein